MPYQSCRVLPPAPIQIARCGPSISPLPQRAVEGAELVVAHGAPHLEDATACQEKEAVVDQLHSGICQLIRHWRTLGGNSSPALRIVSPASSNVGGSLTPISFIRPCISSSALLPRLLAARHETVTSQRQVELIAIPIGKRQAIEQVADCRTIAGNT